MVFRIGSRVLLGLALGLTLACGGSSPAVVSVLPSPSPSPLPSPSPSPSPSECPDGSCGNRSKVVRTQLRLYELFDKDRKLVEAPDPVRGIVTTPIPVGYTVRLDVTGRDEFNRETDGNCHIDGPCQMDWRIDHLDLVDDIVRTPWTHDLKVVKPGRLTVYVIFDGVGSNDLQFTFVP
jgi:hypothetical protein